MYELTGKKVMITGAGSGMGFAMANGFFKAGASVAMIDVNEGVMQKALEIDPTGKSTYGIIGDLSLHENLQKIFKEALDKLGGELDVLINCAGVSIRGDCETYEVEKWHKTMNINVDAVFYMSQLAGNVMLKKGKGKIINMASMLSFFGSGGSIAYSTSKGAVAQITKSLAIAWGAKGINVNALAPGWVETNLTAALRKNVEKTETISKRIPMKRWATSEDIVGPALFLASDASNYVNGVILPVDGGYMAF